MKRTALLIITLTIVSKFVGFGREMVQVYYYGATGISDACIIAMTIPGAIFAFIASGISTVFIPMYTKLESNFGVGRANIYTDNLINILLLLCTLLILFCLIFARPLIRLFALGFEGETLVLAITFTRISLLGIYFTALITVSNAFLQIKGNFAVPALIWFPNNLVIIATIIISSRGNVMILAFGLLLAGAAQFLSLMPFVASKGFRYRLTADAADPHTKADALSGLAGGYWGVGANRYLLANLLIRKPRMVFN